MRGAGSSWWTWMGCSWVFGAAGAGDWMQRELQMKKDSLELDSQGWRLGAAQDRSLESSNFRFI